MPMTCTPQLGRPAGERFFHPELEPLRYAAFFLVFLHHSMPHEAAFYSRFGFGPKLSLAVSTLAISGAFGVQIFFLLSAYLVTELLLRERALRGRIDLGAFYSRRFLRVWPLYFFFLALAYGLQWCIPGQSLPWRTLLSFAVFGGNWWIIFVGFPSSVIFHLWFISAQEQFYFVWPALMRKLSARGLLIAAVALIVGANMLRWQLVVHGSWESKIWCNTFAELDSVGLGVLLALLFEGQVPRIRCWQRTALFAAGVLSFSLAASYFKMKGDPLTVSRIVLGYPCVVLGALAFFLFTLRPQPEAAAPKPSAVRAVLFKVFTYLGSISYGLYMYHILALVLSDYVVPHQASSFGRYLYRESVAMAVTILFAFISYYLLEKPFLNLKQRFRRAQVG